MIKSIRTKLANAIDPSRKALHEYGFVKVKWQSDEDYKAKALASNHRFFEEENGRKATSDQEAIDFTRKYVDELIAKKEVKQEETE